MCSAAGAGAAGEGVEDGDDAIDRDASGVARMRASEIKAELDMRGISYAGIFEKVGFAMHSRVADNRLRRCSIPYEIYSLIRCAH